PLLLPRTRYTLFPYTTLFRSSLDIKSTLWCELVHKILPVPVKDAGEIDGIRRMVDTKLGGICQEAPCLVSQLTVEYYATVGLAADRKSTRLNSSHVKSSYAVF